MWIELGYCFPVDRIQSRLENIIRYRYQKDENKKAYMNPGFSEIGSTGKASENHTTSLQVRERGWVGDMKAAMVDQNLRPKANTGACGMFAPVVVIVRVLKQIHILHLK